jgi:hypothetical protein
MHRSAKKGAASSSPGAAKAQQVWDSPLISLDKIGKQGFIGKTRLFWWKPGYCTIPIE